MYKKNMHIYTLCKDRHKIIYNANDHSIVTELDKSYKYWNTSTNRIEISQLLLHDLSTPALLRNKKTGVVYLSVPYSELIPLFRQTSKKISSLIN